MESSSPEHLRGLARAATELIRSQRAHPRSDDIAKMSFALLQACANTRMPCEFRIA